jgi:hypothetical protein
MEVGMHLLVQFSIVDTQTKLPRFLGNRHGWCHPWAAALHNSVDDLEVMGIEIIREGDTTQWRKLREKYWIVTLKTLTPKD